MITARSDSNRGFQKAKPLTLHISLLLLVFAYAFIGGLAFLKLEAEATEIRKREDVIEKTRCLEKVFLNIKNVNNSAIMSVMTCFDTEIDPRSQWSFVTATLYGFGIVTTLGYNRIAPVTLAGRLFCVLYGLCGIPLTMIIIANIGQFINQFSCQFRKKLGVWIENKKAKKKARMKAKQDAYGFKKDINGNIANEDDSSNKSDDDSDLENQKSKEEDDSISVTALALLIIFLLYVSFGALLLPALNGRIDFLNGIYYNFLCLTAIDFGQLVPQKVHLLPITFIYVCVGLAITTIAIDVGSDYMKRLHYLGRKMKNVATTKIWFGGKQMIVKELLVAVGKKCGVDPTVIASMNLENVVERVIAINEGREPPPDLNDHLNYENGNRCSIDILSLPHMDDDEAEMDIYSEYIGNGCSIDQGLMLLPPAPLPPSAYEELPLLMGSNSGYGMTRKQNSVKSNWSHRLNKRSPLEPKTPSIFDEMSVKELDIDFERKFENAPQRIPSNMNINVIENETISYVPPLQLSKGSETFEPPDDCFNIGPESLKIFKEHLIVLDDSEQTIVVPDYNFAHRGSLPVRVLSNDCFEPRKFKEKKEKYAKDAQKLYETYQEEWKRLERLTVTKLGPRRRSVLDLDHSSSSSPIRVSPKHLHQSKAGSSSAAHSPRSHSPYNRDNKPINDKSLL
uniref:Potassium channel subfamily K member 18 n=1 Tax=Rhabditophanes sp. KR3021 TaxID=114890 RepID=A0AC35UE42_9BILA